MFEHLFAPIKIRDMELKNRIILPAMGTRMAAENGAVTDKLIAYHAARAKGGCALNIVEVAAVHTPSAPAHFVSISEDYLIEGHKKLTDAIHENGGKAGIQLWQGSIAACMDPKAQMLVVSDMNFGAYMIKAITKEQIQEVMVVMGRAQLADPEFANKAHEGRIGDIVHCVGCNQGCYDGFTDVANRPHITCMRNPMIGHESEYDLSKTETPKKVWVVGGGVAGMEAAKILHERGHEVSLFEASDTLGGEFLLAGEAPGKAEMKAAAFEMAEQVEKLVKVYKNTKVDAQMLKDADVDAVILAIGSSPITIKLEGMDKLQHASAPEVLRHEVCPKGKVAVIGGGLVGLETADTLATDGCDVTVLEMKDEIGSDLGSLRKIAVMMKLQQMQVKMLPNSKVCKFTEEGIVLEDETLVPCNCAVFAVGFASNDSHLLVEECEKRQIPCRVIGDAKSARRALDAIAEGFEAARTL